MKNKLGFFLFIFFSTFLFAQKNIELTILEKNKKGDISPIKPIIDVLKNKIIVALGEGTHGTKEFNEIRSEISKELFDKYDFKILAFEGAFGDSYFLNKGINSDQDIREVMKKNLLSIWQTEEFEKLFLWIRNYNKKNSDKIIISGFDVNFLNNSSIVLRNNTFWNNSIDYKNYVDKLIDITKLIDEAWAQSNIADSKIDMKEIVKNGANGFQITNKIDSIYSKKLDNDSKLALSNLKIGLKNFYDASKENYNFSRDSAMAANIIAMQATYKKKMILIVHNGHIALKSTLVEGMGKYLRNKYMDKYYALATLSSNGNYGAMTDNVDTKNNKFEPYNYPRIIENSWEEYFNKFPEKNFFIDFKNQPKDIFNTSLKLRLIGYKPILTPIEDKQSMSEPIRINEIYDGLIYLDSSSAPIYIDR